MSKKKIDFMLTAFRDGFQSVFGARVFTSDFIPAVEAAREAGITYFEAGGGARYQSLYFYCNEDAFDMMDAFREAAGPDANLQTLSRGVNVVGLESQSEDIIDLHAKMFKKHGMTTIRNFDALNDAHNLIHSGRSITNHGLKHQVCVTLMSLPPGCTGAHDADFYEKTLKDIMAADIPFDSVCFKDASGTTTPAVVYETIKRARKLLPEDAYIHFHTHETAGVSVACNTAALDAGANAIDLSLAPVSGGASQPDVLTMWHALRGTDYDLDIDVDKMREVTDVFKDCMDAYFIPPEATAVEPLIPWCPMPGGALTANTQMLRDNGIMEKYPEIIRAMGEVVEKGGFGTSVTPVSQFYFQQAFNNVMFGPWQKIAEPYGQMVLGYFGKTPVEPDPEIVKLASEQLGKEPTTRKPIDMNNEDPNKGVEPAKKMLEDNELETTEENIFIASTCKEKGIAFLKGEATVGVRLKVDEEAKKAAAAAASQPPPKSDPIGVANYDIAIEGKSYNVTVNTIHDNSGSFRATPNLADASTKLPASTGTPAPAASAPQPAPSAAPSGGTGIEVKAQMPGAVFKLTTNVGDTVSKNDPVMILEAMKMEVPVPAPADGTIKEICVTQGQHVSGGQVLVILQ